MQTSLCGLPQEVRIQLTLVLQHTDGEGKGRSRLKHLCIHTPSFCSHLLLLLLLFIFLIIGEWKGWGGGQSEARDYASGKAEITIQERRYLQGWQSPSQCPCLRRRESQSLPPGLAVSLGQREKAQQLTPKGTVES